jgi:mono/diheme cytochrome c family protein
MRRFAGKMLAFLLLLSGGSAMAQAPEAGDPAAGRERAATWCANCHVIEPAQQRGGDAAPSFVAIARRPGTTATGLRAFLAVPHGQMQDYKLSRVDIDNIVAYIVSLR